MLNQSNRPPVIGITAYGRNGDQQYYQYANYVGAVRGAGGVPILLPPEETQIDTLVGLVDALLFTGGGDIDPSRYGGAGHSTIYRIDPTRDAFEIELARAAIAKNVPLLGICRGLQVLAIASGGCRLIPHVPDRFGEQVPHRVHQSQPTTHTVQLREQSKLAKMVNSQRTEVVSWHHQAVEKTPNGWRAVGYAADGLIEALEHEHHPWAVALQWHPEMSLPNDCSQALFKAFVAAGKLYSRCGVSQSALATC